MRVPHCLASNIRGAMPPLYVDYSAVPFQTETYSSRSILGVPIGISRS